MAIRGEFAFAAWKRKLMTLTLAERVAEELKVAREAGISVTVDEVVAIAQPAETRTHLAPPGNVAPAAKVLARTTFGHPSAGLGGLIKTLPDLDRDALIARLHADLARIDHLDGEQLGRLGDNLAVLDAFDLSGQSTAAIRRKIAEAVFAQVTFKDLDKQTGGGVPPGAVRTPNRRG